MFMTIWGCASLAIWMVSYAIECSQPDTAGQKYICRRVSLKHCNLSTVPKKA